MEKGYFALVLHAHLPYVRHPEYDSFLEEDWYFEALTETYLPLLDKFERLLNDGVKYRVTISLSPTLLSMFQDRLLQYRYLRHINKLIDLANREIERTQWVPEFNRIAYFYKDMFMKARYLFEEKYHCNITLGFKRLQDEGCLEVITCAATHGFLPLLDINRNAVRAQIRIASDYYKNIFGRTPKGFWLPECAYRPRYPWTPPLKDFAGEPVLRKGVEEFLSENGLRYFFIDSHLLKGGKAIGVYKDRFEALERLWERFAAQYQERPEEEDKSPHQVYLVSSAPETKRPVAAFTRDPQTGLQVWSGEWGYPGDGNYLDFHKKRFPGGLRYWRVTSAKADLADKEPYHPEWIAGRLRDQADHFVSMVVGLLSEFKEREGRPGMVVAPYDTELIGHWWFEGPEWLYQVLKRFHDHTQVSLSPGGEILTAVAPRAVISLPEGSWGEGGYHWIWLNEMNDWTWRHVYAAEQDMEEMARSWSGDPDPRLQDLLKQCGRSLFLLESSDWQFLISTFSARDYAELRLTMHNDDFRRLAAMTRRYAAERDLPPEEWNFLHLCRERDDIFPDIDPRWWARVEFPPAE